jgi:hypothetical protein
MYICVGIRRMGDVTISGGGETVGTFSIGSWCLGIYLLGLVISVDAPQFHSSWCILALTVLRNNAAAKRFVLGSFNSISKTLEQHNPPLRSTQG